MRQSTDIGSSTRCFGDPVDVRAAERDEDALPLLMIIAEVADVLRVTERTVRRWEAEGRLRSLKLTPGRGGRRVYARTEVLRFVAEAGG